jgi:diguanylate cyclase (GGDEF)-like protein
LALRVLAVFSTTNYAGDHCVIDDYLSTLEADLDNRGVTVETVRVDDLTDDAFRKRLRVANIVLFLLSPQYVDVWGERFRSLAATAKAARVEFAAVAVDGLTRAGLPPAPLSYHSVVLDSPRGFALNLKKDLDAIQSRYDDRTPLRNHRALYEDLPGDRQAAAAAGRRLAALFLDLDEFKRINDDYGHLTADKVLQEFAQRLADVVGERGKAYRDAGDEFVVTASVAGLGEAEALVQQIRDATSAKPFTDHEVPLGVSVGLAVGREDHQADRALIEAADDAMRADKRARGKGR